MKCDFCLKVFKETRNWQSVRLQPLKRVWGSELVSRPMAFLSEKLSVPTAMCVHLPGDPVLRGVALFRNTIIKLTQKFKFPPQPMHLGIVSPAHQQGKRREWAAPCRHSSSASPRCLVQSEPATVVPLIKHQPWRFLSPWSYHGKRADLESKHTRKDTFPCADRPEIMHRYR